MMKRILFSMILMLSFNVVQAFDYSRDEQTKMVEKLAKKVLRAQAAGKSNQLILDEMLTEVAAQFGELAERADDKNNFHRMLLIGRIVGCVLIVGIGSYFIYKHYSSKKALALEEEHKRVNVVHITPPEPTTPAAEATSLTSVQPQGESMNTASGQVSETNLSSATAIARPISPVRGARLLGPVIEGRRFEQFSPQQAGAIDGYLNTFPENLRAPFIAVVDQQNLVNLANAILRVDRLGENATPLHHNQITNAAQRVFGPTLEQLTPHQQDQMARHVLGDDYHQVFEEFNPVEHSRGGYLQISPEL